MEEYTQAEAHIVRLCGTEGLPGIQAAGRDWSWLQDGEGNRAEGLPEPEEQYGFRRYEWPDGSAIVTSGKEWFFGFHRSWMGYDEVRFGVADSGENIPAEFTNPATLGMEDMIRPRGGPGPSGTARREPDPGGGGQESGAAAPETAGVPVEAPGAGRGASEDESRTGSPGSDRGQAGAGPETREGEPLDEVMGSFEERTPKPDDPPDAAMGAGGEQDSSAARRLPAGDGAESPPGLPEILTDRDRLIYVALEFGRLWEAAQREDDPAVRLRAARLRSILDYGEGRDG